MSTNHTSANLGLSSLWKDGNKFDQWIAWLESSVGGPKHTVAEIRKDPKAEKGRLWEHFCAKWLVASRKLDQVYLWAEIPAEIRRELGLRRQDIGIDLIGWKGERIFAIQAKYRKHTNTRPATVPWRELSTFWGLVARTGFEIGNDQREWDGHWVCTNCRGVTWKVSKTPKDRVFANGTFRATRTPVWERMAGNVGHRITDSSDDLSDNEPSTEEQLRQKRIAYFTAKFDSPPEIE